MKALPQNFDASIADSGKVLRALGLLYITNPMPSRIDAVASRARKLSYIDTWRLLLSESAYKFLLADYGFVSFEQTQTTVSYSYYPNPYSFQPYLAYLQAVYEDKWEREIHDRTNEEAYLYELENADESDGALLLRFDYAPGQYSEGRHPAAHLHFGFNTDVRLGSRVIMNPLAFTCFVARQFYPACWADEYAAIAAFADACRAEELEGVHDDYLNPRDTIELYLS